MELALDVYAGLELGVACRRLAGLVEDVACAVEVAGAHQQPGQLGEQRGTALVAFWQQGNRTRDQARCGGDIASQGDRPAARRGQALTGPRRQL